jgi:tetratricopeptide (TPR) repeat protein
MQVTDTDGYIMRTDISYQPDQNRICISPLDTYEENRFYLLNISKNVCSARGQPLKTTIHIIFKLYKAQVSEYKVLRNDVELPKAVSRPANYDAVQANRVPSALEMMFDEKKAKELLEAHVKAYEKESALSEGARMETVPVRINLWTGLAGLVLVLVGFALETPWVVALAAGVCIIGAVHLFVQLRDKEMASKIHYNSGVKMYNAKRLAEAKEEFKKALQINPRNSKAKLNLDRINFHK